jgi:sRNA-binding protein
LEGRALALAICTSNIGYLRAVRESASRINLAGDAVGSVTTEEAEHAKQRWQERRQSKAPPAPKPAAPRRLDLADLRSAVARRTVLPSYFL